MLVQLEKNTIGLKKIRQYNKKQERETHRKNNPNIKSTKKKVIIKFKYKEYAIII